MHDVFEHDGHDIPPLVARMHSIALRRGEPFYNYQSQLAITVNIHYLNAGSHFDQLMRECWLDRIDNMKAQKCITLGGLRNTDLCARDSPGQTDVGVASTVRRHAKRCG